MYRAFSTSLLVVVAALSLWSCDDESEALIPCENTRECAEGEETQGAICVDGFCQQCRSDEECSAPESYGPGAACSDEGLCEIVCPPGTEDCPCAEAETCGDGLSCVEDICVPEETGCLGCSCHGDGTCDEGTCQEGYCLDCTMGELGCACHGDGSCDEGTCELESGPLGICVECTEGARGCACYADGTCDGGLRCQDGLCVSACEPEDSGSAGCPCRPGGECDVGYTCRDGVCGLCDSATEGCPCEEGACIALVCGDGERCRQAVTCDELSCDVEHQVCQPSRLDADAACLPQCQPPYDWNVSERSCELPDDPPNCIPGAADSIYEDCLYLGRYCDDSPDLPRCGDCRPWFVTEGDACRAIRTCADLGCAERRRACTPATETADAECEGCLAGYRECADGCCAESGTDCDDIGAECEVEHRECLEYGDFARCGDCLAGFHPHAASGACLEEVNCIEGDPASRLAECRALNRVCEGAPLAECTECLPGFMESPGGGGACVRAGCTESEVFDVHTDSCVPCTLICGGEGETGAIAEGTVWSPVHGRGICICETEENYFSLQPPSAGTFPCDADGDGWLREEARAAIESSDPVQRANARCHAFQVRAFQIMNEMGEYLDVPVDEGPIGGPLFLFESRRNDDQAELSLATAEVPVYGTGRALRAEELNSLTKACVSTSADHNANDIDDVLEAGGMEPGAGIGSDFIALYRLYTRYSYFVELHDGAFIADDPSALTAPSSWPNIVEGVYRIVERRRDIEASLGGVGVTYDVDASRGQYAQCLRHRDADWSVDIAEAGFDLAEHEWPSGEAVMTHHSQYRCLEVVSDCSSGACERYQVDLSSLPPVDSSRWTANECAVPGSYEPTTAPNPNHPIVTCDPTLWSVSGAPEVGTVFWGAVNYLHGALSEAGAPYQRGCINECTEQQIIAPEDQCPGFDPSAPDERVGWYCEADPENFGAIHCGCGLNFGGPECEVPCAHELDETTGQPLLGRGELFLEEGYSILDRSGYWMCGHMSASGPVSGGDGVHFAEPGGGYTIQGEIPISTAHSDGPLTGGGYSLTPLPVHSRVTRP